jgi:DNA-binding SARP family transcriptional activator/tetratricopeptide (TPR) repeat protein
VGADGAAPVTLRVLGTVEASAGGRPVGLGGPLQKALLVRALLAGETPVPADQVAEDLWGERADATKIKSVHVYAARLRKILGEAAFPRGRDGYLVDRSAVTVDADLFVREVHAGNRSLGRRADAEAAQVLAAALARWAGPSAYAGMGDFPFLSAEIARLDALRVEAVEALAEAHARMGRAAEDAGRLAELAARDPLRESLIARLMVALAAAGRQADALAAYERCREALAGELGVEPGPALRDVRRAVLAQEQPAVTGAPARRPGLPERNRSFVGRTQLIAAVEEALDGDGRPVALCGLAGAGKTELAREVAHRRRRDGRVAWWIPAEDPAAIAASLDDLARTLGVAPHQREEDARAALWAELDRTAGWVLVYDNAEEPARLEPYLPVPGRGDVIITSRDRAWRRLATPLVVPPLARSESLAFVADRTGDRDAAAATSLAELLGDLPLALQQACAYVEQTAMPVAEYVRLFRRRAVDLRAGGISTTWDLAADRLRRRSRLGAVVLEAMAFLSPDAVPVALLRSLAEGEWDLQDAIGELLRLALVDRTGAGLRVHRLVQVAVRDQLTPVVARERLLAAAGLAVAHEQAEGDATAHLVVLTAHATALGVVPEGLLDTVAEAAGRLAERALYPAAEQLLRAALELAGIAGEVAATGALLCRLGEVLDAAGHLDEALDLHRKAVVALDGATDRVVVARAHNRLGHVLNCADDARGAIAEHERALAVLRAADRADLTGPVLVDLGYVRWATHDLDRAKAAFDAGRELLAGADERGRSWPHSTAGLGMVAQDRGDLDRAVALQREAIEEFTAFCGADHPDTAQAFDKLGYALRLQGRAEEAIEAHGRAARLLTLVLGADDPRVAMTLSNLGLAQADAGLLDEALETEQRAHTLFHAAYGAAHAHTLMAAVRRAGVLVAAGHQAQARAVLAAIRATLDARPGSVAGVARDLAAVYTALGEPDAARSWEERA